jgi:hypothetical protein
MSTDTTAQRRVPRRALVVGGIGLAAVAVGGILAFAVASGSPEPTPSPTPSPRQTASPSPTPSPTVSPTASPSPSPTPVARCPLDGEPLAEDAQLVEPALAVQIENHPEARPARNLTRADIVIEGLVEGDTTRFTALYLCDPTVGMTGPVRSARYYNVDLWQDIHVLTVGFGASPGALERFAVAGMPYPNGIDGWPWYQRYGGRAAPHNLYVDLEALRADLDRHSGLMAMAERVEPLRPPWTFDEEPDLPDAGREVTSLAISTNSFWHFGWTWDPELSAYHRSDAGVETIDEATEEPLAFTSLIVQRVTQEVVFGDPDPGGNARRLQHLVGSGEGVLYTQGRAYDIRWERPTAGDRTTWTFADTGEPLVLPPGEVWWHILPHETPVSER